MPREFPQPLDKGNKLGQSLYKHYPKMLDMAAFLNILTRISNFQIVDPLQVYDNINLGRRIDPQWPEDEWRLRGGRNDWKDWLPEEGMEGTVSST